jgi:signal peptidase I
MVFAFPGNRRDDFIKRVIALPGDELRVQGGHPIINGWRVPSCKVGTLEYSEGDDHPRKRGELDIEFYGDYAYLTLFEEERNVGEEDGPYHVADGEVWVLGDNRNNSSDSRAWNNGRGGGVPFSLIKGRAMFVWLSFSRGGGITYSRLLHNVMGKPTLPKDQATPELIAGIERCLGSRPAQTLPPPRPGR